MTAAKDDAALCAGLRDLRVGIATLLTLITKTAADVEPLSIAADRIEAMAQQIEAQRRAGDLLYASACVRAEKAERELEQANALLREARCHLDGEGIYPEIVKRIDAALAGQK